MKLRVTWICVVSFILTLFFVFLATHSTPVLHIQLSSDVQGTSQLFYKKNGGAYTQAFSLQAPLKQGEQTLSYTPPKFSHTLRWKPAEVAGTFLVEKIWIQTHRMHFDIKLAKVVPKNEIASMTITDQGLAITTTANSTDPQVEFTTPMAGIYAIKYLASFLAFIMALVFLYSIREAIGYIKMKCSFCNKQKNQETQENQAGFFNKISQTLQGEYFFSFSQFAVFFLITFVLYGYFLTHFSLSIDSEYAAFRFMSKASPTVWIGQGRWLCYLIERFLPTQVVLPYAPHLLFCISVSLSYMLIVSMYKIRDRFLAYITYPLFCAFPVWLFILAFYANINPASVGLLLTSFAIFIFSVYRNSFLQQPIKWQKQLFPVFIQGILLAMAIGAYQAFLPVYMSMGLGLILFKTLISDRKADALREMFLNIVYLGCVALVGLIIYSVINKTALWLIPSSTSYIDGFMAWQDIFKAPMQVLGQVFHQIFAYYSGAEDRYSASLSLTGILLIVTTVLLLLHPQEKDRKKIIATILLWVIVLIAPFLINFMSHAALVPTRGLLAIPYVIWLSAIVSYTVSSQWIRKGVLILVVMLELQIVHVMGINAAAMDLVGNHDRALAASLYERVGYLSSDGCSETPCKIDVFGLSHVTIPYSAAWSSTMGASFFEWDGGNVYRMIAFMRVLGYTNLEATLPEERQKNTPLFEKMPVWPAEGSVVKVKDTYLIKLSKQPDPTHTQ